MSTATIDPVSGMPVQTDVLAATVVETDCGFADALATACMTMPAADAITAMLEACETLACSLSARRHYCHSRPANFRCWNKAKKSVVSRHPTVLNLKSNTMKNTVQIIAFVSYKQTGPVKGSCHNCGKHVN